MCTLACKEEVSQKNKEEQTTSTEEESTRDWTDSVAVNYEKAEIVKEVPISEKEDLKTATKELVDGSFNSGKSCDDILKDYEAFIKKLSEDFTQEGLKELTKWANDPLYNDCYNREKSFRSKADLLDEMLE